MPKKGKTGKTKVRNTENNRVRKIKAEIHKCEKKLKKLLARFEDGKKRWKWKGRKVKEPINKLQGIAPNSKRHEKLNAHISSLKKMV